MGERELGFSILKNLGLKKEDVVHESFELKVRPRQAGLSHAIDGTEEQPTLLRAVGAWRYGGPCVPSIERSDVVHGQHRFCESSKLAKFQTSLCRFHEMIGCSLPGDGERRSVQMVGKPCGRSSQQKVLELSGRVVSSSDNYEDMFACVLEIAKSSEVTNRGRKSVAVFQKEEKDRVSAKSLAMAVAKAYSERMRGIYIYNVECVDDWVFLREWMFDVQAALAPESRHDVLWTKFVRRVVYHEARECLSVDSSKACVKWASTWVDHGLINAAEMGVLFIEVAKSFLVDNLRCLCLNGQIHWWLELAADAGIMSQLGVIVRLHAESALEKWAPPDPMALNLMMQWPHVLNNSDDFMYRSIGPKLSLRLAVGDIDSFLPFADILPISLSASIISDSYLTYVITEMSKVVNSDIRQAALIYSRARSRIPRNIACSPKVIQRLIDALDRLKERNPVLRGLKVATHNLSTTVSDLLESIAAKHNIIFAPQGTIDGFTAYRVGDHQFGVSDGVLYHRNGRLWNQPVMVNDIAAIVQ